MQLSCILNILRDIPFFHRIIYTELMLKLPANLTDLLKLGIFPFLVFMLNYTLGSVFSDQYYAAVHADIPMHFFGGMSIAYSAWRATALLERKGLLVIRNGALRAFAIVCVVMLVAVVWEFYEFLSDHFVGTHYQPNNADTMKDLCMGMIGAIIFLFAKMETL